jgi:thiol:disulfide interchange protein
MSNRQLRQGFTALGLLLLSAVAWGQQFQLPSAGQLQGLQPSAGAEGEAIVTTKAVFTAPAEGQPGRLYVTADIKKGWHVYSLTQPKGGPVPTKIKLPTSAAFRLTGDFKAAPPPTVHKYPDAYGDLPVEEHAGRVVWHAPIELAAGTDPRSLRIDGKLNVQACDAGQCLAPKDYAFTAALGAAPQLAEQPKVDQASATTGVYQNPRAHARISGHVQPAVAAPGQMVQLTITAELAEQWHIYALAEKAPAAGSKPTLIVLTDLPAGWTASAPRASNEPIVKQDGPVGFDQPYHEQPVSWTIDLSLPADAQSGQQRVAGLMGYQTCWTGGCDLPTGVRFEGSVQVAKAPEAGQAPLAFTDARYAEAARLAEQRSSTPSRDQQAPVAGFDPNRIRPSNALADSSAGMPLMMVFGFLGGLILNLMPCVLPVIGLKILSFVEQSGQDRGRVLWLNIWYSLGLMSVFMVLAGLAAFVGLGWGQQFSNSTFNIALAAVVFAMALSFLGVWEIPIPGFIGSGRANDLAAREGVAGAFAKGMITTVLATPCTGPFLGTSLAWAVRQPPHVTFMLFGCVGLGMASPYLLLGAFPSLVRFLPKPGAWMETFKQLMGFVLLGTVVFLLTFIEWPLVVPTVALLFGIWLACWWIGRTPLTADLAVKARAWMWAVTLTGLSALVCFNWLGPVMQERFVARIDKEVGGRISGVAMNSHARVVVDDDHRLPWRPFSKQALAELTGQRKTVMVDFTADWCLVCKSLEKLVLNTEPVKGVIDANQVVPLLADWTSGDEEVTAMLDLLGGKSVPVLAIFPASRPNEPIVFRDTYTRQQLIDALEKAGPSHGAAGNATAMIEIPR